MTEALRLAFPTGTTVVAGHAGPQPSITWAQVLRGRPISLASVESGELILFSPGAASLLGGETALARLMRNLAEAGAAAFAVSQAPSPELLDVANTLAIPLILVPEGIPPTEIERSILSLLLDRDEYLRKWVDGTYERMLETLIDEDGAVALAQKIHVATGKAVYLLDPYLQLLASASPLTEMEVPALRQRLAALAHAAARSGGRPIRLSLAECTPASLALVRLLELRGTHAGFLCLLGPEQEFDELDERVAERAASVLVIELAKQRAIAEARLRLQSDFLDDLLDGAFSNPEAMALRARTMGYELSRPYLVFVLEAAPPGDGSAAARIRQRFVEAARNDLLRTDPGALLRDRGGRVAVLKPIEGQSRTEQQTLVEALRVRLSQAADGAPIAVGIGRNPTQVDQFPSAYREAVMALEVALVLMDGNTSLRFEDLGVQRLLFQLVDNPELQAYRRDHIGALEDYDARHGSELAHTLEVYFACHGNHMRAARELHLHRNTLIYRLERAQAILGKDLDDPDTRLAVQLALKLRHVPSLARLDGGGLLRQTGPHRHNHETL